MTEFLLHDVRSHGRHLPLGLQQLLARAEKDDIIICTKMDRLGRNTADMIHIVDACYKKGLPSVFLKMA
jgi:DNA invertase Pin-like site-specific DNA recombinase